MIFRVRRVFQLGTFTWGLVFKGKEWYAASFWQSMKTYARVRDVLQEKQIPPFLTSESTNALTLCHAFFGGVDNSFLFFSRQWSKANVTTEKICRQQYTVSFHSSGPIYRYNYYTNTKGHNKERVEQKGSHQVAVKPLRWDTSRVATLDTRQELFHYCPTYSPVMRGRLWNTWSTSNPVWSWPMMYPPRDTRLFFSLFALARLWLGSVDSRHSTENADIDSLGKIQSSKSYLSCHWTWTMSVTRGGAMASWCWWCLCCWGWWWLQ